MGEALSTVRAGASPGDADCLVVLLHGYGADGRDLIGLAGELGRALPAAAFVAPDAPEPCLIHAAGRQWFPIPSMDGSTEAAAAHSFGTAEILLNRFLDEEARRFALEANRMALLGFSQGAMMALHVGYRRAEAMAGIVGISGRLLAPERLAGEIRQRTPTLLVHGSADEVVPTGSIHEARIALEGAGVPVHWVVEPGVGHGIGPTGLGLAQSFLTRRLGPLAAGGADP